MSFSPAILYDILFLIVFSFAAVKSWQKGFLAGLAELIGAVLGVGIAVWGSRTLAPEIYQRFFSDAIAWPMNASYSPKVSTRTPNFCSTACLAPGR